MTDDRNKPTLADVWLFVCEGCNAHEIATWYGVTEQVADAWMVRARIAFKVGRIREAA